MNRMQDDDEVFNSSGTLFPNKTISQLHNLYLVGEIGEPTGYTQWFEIIRNAKEHDVVYIHINSPGGNMFTALQLIRCIHESKATIIASVEGMCLSAATLVFLNTHQCEVSEHSMFMFHNYSSMVMGKGGEMFEHISAAKKWSTRLFNQAYNHFLTSEEIMSILDNRDLWMDSEEVVQRLKKKADMQKEKTAEEKAAKTADATPVKKTRVKKTEDATVPVPIVKPKKTRKLPTIKEQK